MAVTSISIATRNRRRKFAKRLIKGSEAIYHDVNSKIDQVTYRAIGKKIIAYMSSLKLRVKEMYEKSAQGHENVRAFVPVLRKRIRGIRLVKKASLIAVFTFAG